MLFYVVWQGRLGRQQSARKHDLDFKNPRFCRTDTSATTAPHRYQCHHCNTQTHQNHHSAMQTLPAPLHQTDISTTTIAPHRVARLLQHTAPLHCLTLICIVLHALSNCTTMHKTVTLSAELPATVLEGNSICSICSTYLVFAANTRHCCTFSY